MPKTAIKCIKNQKYNKIFSNVCLRYNVANYFNYIHSTFIDCMNKEIHSLMIDPCDFYKFYLEENLIIIDPTINFIFNSNREIILFEELDYIEAINKKGEIYYPGKIINAYKSSSRFNMKNGFYTITRFNSKYCFVNSYAYDSKNYAVDKFLELNTIEGKWFNEFTKNLNYITLNLIKDNGK